MQCFNTTNATDTLLTRMQLAATFLCGIALCHTPTWPGAAVLTCLLAWLYATATHKKRIVILALLLFSTGYARLWYQQTTYRQTVAHIAADKPLYLQGVIQQLNKANHQRYRSVYTICITHFYDQETKIYKPYATSWQLQCYAAHRPWCTVGDTIQLHNIKVNTKPKASFSHYLIKEHIHATSFIGFNDYILLSRPSWHLGRSFHNCKQHIYDRLKRKCSTSTFALISLIFFGNRLQVKSWYQKLKDLFGAWGIIHFLARSGLHLIIFVLMLSFCLQWLPLPFLYKQLLTVGISLLYACLSWSSISFLRALCTFLWYSCCRCFGMQVDTLYIILMLAGSCLLANPMLLFFLDFQLSFGLTLILSLAMSHLVSKKQPA